ncbi:MAG TPA: hypothetical protein PK544_17425 [Spirochaetota bacterium]|nr:hypothetical protein [Spirochaetota bacterium]
MNTGKRMCGTMIVFERAFMVPMKSEVPSGAEYFTIISPTSTINV